MQPAPAGQAEAAVGEPDRAAIRRRNSRIVYAITFSLMGLVFAVPRLWLTIPQFKDKVGPYAGYLCTFWLGLILLMPTAARFLRGRWVRLMVLRKDISIGCGFFIMAHGYFSHAIKSAGQNEAWCGGGSGVINFILVTVLMFTSIDAVRLAMPRKWWEWHQRIGTFGLFIIGTNAAGDTESFPVLAKVAITFAYLVLLVRVVQFIIDFRRVRRDRLVANAVGMVVFFSFVFLAEFTRQIGWLMRTYGLGLAAAGALYALYRLVGRLQRGGPPPKKGRGVAREEA